MMEQPKNTEQSEKPKTPEEELADFRAEVAAIASDEASGKVKSHHFFGMSEEDLKTLDATDMDAWKKFKHDELPLKEFKEYRNEVLKVLHNDPTKKAADLLAMYMANKINIKEMEKYAKEHESDNF